MFAGAETTNKIMDYFGVLGTGEIILGPVGDALVLFDTLQDAILTEYEVIFSFLSSHHRPSDTAGWDLTTLVQVAPLATLSYADLHREVRLT